MAATEFSTRQRILEAAEPLFAKRGFSGVSMRSIADAAGVLLGVLPYHFGTKEALYRSIWEQWQETIEIHALLREAQSKEDGSLESRLRAIIEAFFAGPRSLLRDPRGHHFVAIMVREANDPTNSKRTLLEDFIYPNGNALRRELALLFPDIPDDVQDVAFEMMVSALRIVIERKPKSGSDVIEPEAANKLFALLTDFVAQGWLSLNNKAPPTRPSQKTRRNRSI